MILKHACGLELEGIVSKRKDAPYRSGRSENFIKSKCHNAQEFVVAGYSPASADPHAVGALTVAVHDNGELRYAGRVGTGYTHKSARELWQRLKSLKIDKPPLTLPQGERRKDVIWVKPQLVIEAEYRGVTHGDVLRQASFKGLREDKPAREVVREVPRSGDGAAAGGAEVGKDKWRSKSRGQIAGKDAVCEARGCARQGKRAQPADVGNVHLTHPDRVYWVDVGVTKEDLAEYYVSVWDWMAPHVVDRPLALVRCPGGTKGQCFFQKHIAENVKDSPLRHAVDAKEHDVIAVEKLDDVVALVQSGTLEIHTRGSRLQKLELCDRIVFDLDPGDGVSWKEIVAAAREVRERLEAVKLEKLCQVVGRQGHPCGGADRRRRLGHDEEFQPKNRARHGRRQPAALRRQNDQGAAQRQNLHRLFPQHPRGDLGRALFDPRPPRRRGLGAAIVGTNSAAPRALPISPCSI